MQVISAGIAALLGVLVGGLVNVLADDLPVEEDEAVRLRAPHYPDGTPRPWLGLWAFIRDRRGLGWRYPLVEVALAVWFGLLVWFYPLDLQLLFYLFYAALFTLVTVIDIEHHLILFITMLPTAGVALIDAVFIVNPMLVFAAARADGAPVMIEAQTGGALTLTDSLLGGALGFGVFWLFWYGGVWFNKARARNLGVDADDLEVAFGFGDVMLAGVCGLILGWQALIFAMFITVFAGAAGGLLWIVSRFFSADGYALFTALPYGPYIVFGTVMMLYLNIPVKILLFPEWLGLR